MAYCNDGELFRDKLLRSSLPSYRTGQPARLSQVTLRYESSRGQLLKAAAHTQACKRSQVTCRLQ